MEVASVLVGLEIFNLLLTSVVSILLIVRQVREARRKPPLN